MYYKGMHLCICIIFSVRKWDYDASAMDRFISDNDRARVTVPHHLTHSVWQSIKLSRAASPTNIVCDVYIARGPNQKTT